MKRRNVVPGAFALSYLLSFNNKLHTRKKRSSSDDFLGKTIRVDAAERCRVPSSSGSPWERGPMWSGKMGRD